MNIDYDLVNYKYQQMRPRDLLLAFQTILLFESIIQGYQNSSDDLPELTTILS